ncbi:MAG: helix-turn-helix domain-containing protein [Patescibacteria group bacterium]
MNIKPIKNQKDYNIALARVEELWNAKPNTKAGYEFDILVTLIEKYEADNYEILPPDPIEAIKFRMEQMGLKQKDLAEIIGANRVSEILNKKRKLSLNMIRSLHTKLNIPTESLIN